jgi:hypothetical protein
MSVDKAIRWAEGMLYYGCASYRNEMLKEWVTHLPALLEMARHHRDHEIHEGNCSTCYLQSKEIT